MVKKSSAFLITSLAFEGTIYIYHLIIFYFFQFVILLTSQIVEAMTRNVLIWMEITMFVGVKEQMRLTIVQINERMIQIMAIDVSDKFKTLCYNIDVS